MQSGEVKDTLHDYLLLENWIDYRPLTTVEDGVNKLIYWYKSFYKEF